ncbi:hypothetical protein ABBQ32_001641 [Trebouxia sp. C0010 RCD-2024]
MADVEQAEQGEKPLTTADLLKSHTVKVIESHMASNYEESAVGIALEAAHKFKQYKDIASHVKHQFDKKYPGSGKASEGVFHCICGKSFASKWISVVSLQIFIGYTTNVLFANCSRN